VKHIANVISHYAAGHDQEHCSQAPRCHKETVLRWGWGLDDLIENYNMNNVTLCSNPKFIYNSHRRSWGWNLVVDIGNIFTFLSTRSTIQESHKRKCERVNYFVCTGPKIRRLFNGLVLSKERGQRIPNTNKTAFHEIFDV
jgi:hypothetical protein